VSIRRGTVSWGSFRSTGKRDDVEVVAFPGAWVEVNLSSVTGYVCNRCVGQLEWEDDLLGLISNYELRNKFELAPPCDCSDSQSKLDLD
jgi:hypothetical protein